MRTKQEYQEVCGRYPSIPGRTLYGLYEYVNERVHPGHFLTAVLENDLQGAVAHADEGNLAALPDIAKVIYNNVPGSAHGSRAAVGRWLNQFCGEEN